MRHAILGGGPLGAALFRMLQADGNNVDLFSIMGNPDYDMPGTTPRAIDGADIDAVCDACAGAEVIYLCLNAHYVDWYEQFPPRLDVAIDVAAKTGARLLFHDSMHMFRPGAAPLTESTAFDSTSRKGRLRATMATTFMNAANSGKLTGAIGRSADMYGPGALNSSFNSTLGQRHFYPMLEGKRVSILGDIDQPHTYSFVDDVARGLITLGENDKAMGKAWHLPSAPTLTLREIMALAFDVADMRPRIRGSKVSAHVVRLIGRFQTDVAEVVDVLDQFEHPFIVSHDAFERSFGAEPTPHRPALQETIEWYRANPLAVN